LAAPVPGTGRFALPLPGAESLDAPGAGMPFARGTPGRLPVPVPPLLVLVGALVPSLRSVPAGPAPGGVPVVALPELPLRAPVLPMPVPGAKPPLVLPLLAPVALPPAAAPLPPRALAVPPALPPAAACAATQGEVVRPTASAAIASQGRAVRRGRLV
jgi:hypothetical protein